MLTDAAILQRRTNYACCALDYLSRYGSAVKYGDHKCAQENKRLWLYMLWAKGVADRTPTSTEDFGRCITHSFAQRTFKNADCYCDQCGCPAEDCTRVASYTAIAAVDVADRAAIELAGPAVGDTYFVVSGIDDGVWAVGFVEVWNGSGWDSTELESGEYVLIGTYYWRIGQGGIPGMADPPVTVTWVGPPDMYTIVSDYPSIALNSGRFAYVIAFGPGGWEIVMQTFEVNLATPIPLPIVGYDMSNISVIYVGGINGGGGDCETYSPNGMIFPPGCYYPRAHSCLSHSTLSHS